MMELVQQRVVREKEALDSSIRALHVFIGGAGGDVYAKLPDDERTRLHRQLDVMREYSAILGERIAAFS